MTNGHTKLHKNLFEIVLKEVDIQALTCIFNTDMAQDDKVLRYLLSFDLQAIKNCSSQFTTVVPGIFTDQTRLDHFNLTQLKFLSDLDIVYCLLTFTDK